MSVSVLLLLIIIILFYDDDYLEIVGFVNGNSTLEYILHYNEIEGTCWIGLYLVETIESWEESISALHYMLQ